jgi:hypothetical protein
VLCAIGRPAARPGRVSLIAFEVSRSDIAAFILGELEERAFVRATPGVSY